MIASRRDFGVSAEAFPLGAVALLPGPFRDDASRAHARLLRLDPDRLLHTFRRNAGLPSEVVPCGGWEAPSSELRGHSTGHVLSALAQAHATSGDRAFSVRAEYFVEQLALCQDRARTAGYSTGYLSAFPEGFLGRVEARQPVLAPYATLHKIMAGLLDVHVHVGSRQALTVLSRMAAWAGWRLGRLSPRQRQDVLATESGGMNEVLANLYQLTGDPAHLLTARHFDHAEVFDRLAKPPAGDRCTKELGGDAGDHHAKVLGAIRAYHATGTARYRDIAMTFWDLAAARTCRGWCDADGVLELARQLFRTDPGRTRYFDHAAKVLHDLPPVVPNPDDFTCCHGSGLEVRTRHGDSVYLHAGTTLYVNLFVPSVLTWPGRGISVRQDTSFPDAATTRLTITGSGRVDLRLRVPAGAEGARLLVNGVVEGRPAAGTYARVDRHWVSGDIVDLNLQPCERAHKGNFPDETIRLDHRIGEVLTRT